MKLNISYPNTGCQKLIEIEDERKVRSFYDKRMAMEVAGDCLGDEWKGYVFRISGGNDKQGFPMKQGVMTNGRVRLLLSKGHSCYRPRRTGERKRKSPKIQRLVTPVVLQRKRHRMALKRQRAQKAKQEAADYAKLLAKRAKEAKDKRHDTLMKKRRASSLRDSVSAK